MARGSGSRHGSVHSLSPVRPMGLAMRMDDKLVGNEDVWEGGLQMYQRKRENEVDSLAGLTQEDIVSLLAQVDDLS
jgi:hypothetical protein